MTFTTAEKKLIKALPDEYSKLVHALTAYDRKQESKRGHNIWALGIYFNALEDFKEYRAKGDTTDRALEKCYNGRLLTALQKALKL